MKQEVLDAKKKLIERVVRGDISRAAIIAMGEGANRQVFDAWLKADELWPRVDERNIRALGQAISEREKSLRAAIREAA